MGILNEIVEGFIRTIIGGFLVLLGFGILMGGLMWSIENNSTIGNIVTFLLSLGLIGAGVTVGRKR